MRRTQFCASSSDESSKLLPYFAVTDKEGNYAIKNVPAGHYTVKTWSEEAKPTTQAVDVAADGATLNLTVKK